MLVAEQKLLAERGHAGGGDDEPRRPALHRVAMVAVEEDERATPLDLVPEAFQQYPLALGLVHPTAFARPIRWREKVDLVLVENVSQLLLAHPAVGRRTDTERRQHLGHRWEPAPFERIVMRDPIRLARERVRVTSARRQPAVELVDRRAHRFHLALVHRATRASAGAPDTMSSRPGSRRHGRPSLGHAR